MAMVDRGADRGVRAPGAYESLLHRQCVRETRPDPRLFYALGDDDGHAAFKRAKQQANHAAEVLFRERLEAGEPLNVPRWMIGGRDMPVPRDAPLFQDRSVATYRVYPGDRIEIAERHEPL